jgi:AraC-like DNA-binding protein
VTLPVLLELWRFNGQVHAGAAHVGGGLRGTVHGVSSAERVSYLRSARDLMDLRYAEPLDLDQMAARAGFSKFHFARAFKEAYGETPAHYFTRRRMERAKDLLRSANLTVTEVCILVGFSSLGSFSARFSQLVGMSPSAFQRASAARGGPPPIPGCFLMDWSRPRPKLGNAKDSNPGEA